MAIQHAFWPALILSGVFCLGCRADTVYLSNGTEVNGTVVEDNGTTVVVKLPGGALRSYRKSDVDAVVYDKKAARGAEPAARVAAETEPAAVVPGQVESGDAKKKEGEGEAKGAEGAKDAKDEKDKWTPPPGLPGFPKNAQRMEENKERQFMGLLKDLEDPDSTTRESAKAGMQGLGNGVLPYVVSVIQHSNVDVRTEALLMIAQLNGRPAIKQTIEALFAAVPADGDLPRFQELYIRAFKSVLPSITGQDFLPAGEIQTEPQAVRDGLGKYIAWYEENFDRMPKQLGETEVEATDPDYATKLKDARKLNLSKKAFLRPPSPEEVATKKINENRPAATEQIVLPLERQYIQRNTPGASARNDKMLEKFKNRDVLEDPRERKVDRR